VLGTNLIRRLGLELLEYLLRLRFRCTHVRLDAGGRRYAGGIAGRRGLI